MDKIHIETAKRTDAGVILALIRELAIYENMSHLVEATVEMIEENVFDKGGAQVLLAKEDGEPVGFALFFENFSTFKGKCGVYLEDLYVKKENAAKATVRRCFLRLCTRRRYAARDVWSGRVSTGTSRRLTFIYPWVRSRLRIGRCTGWTRRRWTAHSNA